MPRIAAATVQEHRENVLGALVDAAEAIVRADGVDALTAGAVTHAAGIARNSIYRYVDSVEDLRGLILERHLPDWMRAVATAVGVEVEPAGRIEAWCRANLEQAAATGHGWLIDLAKGATLGTGTRDAVDHAHRDAEDILLVEWGRLASTTGTGTPAERATIAAELTRSLVDGGFRLLDRGIGLDAVLAQVLRTVRALIAAETAP